MAEAPILKRHGQPLGVPVHEDAEWSLRGNNRISQFQELRDGVGFRPDFQGLNGRFFISRDSKL